MGTRGWRQAAVPHWARRPRRQALRGATLAWRRGMRAAPRGSAPLVVRHATRRVPGTLIDTGDMCAATWRPPDGRAGKWAHVAPIIACPKEFRVPECGNRSSECWHFGLHKAKNIPFFLLFLFCSIRGCLGREERARGGGHEVPQARRLCRGARARWPLEPDGCVCASLTAHRH